MVSEEVGEERRDQLAEVKGGEQKSLEQNSSTIRKGPSAAAQMKVVQFSEGVVNKEVMFGNLWRDQHVVVIVLPDLRSMSCRRMLLSAGILQAQLLSYEVPMCLVFGTRNPRHAQVCMEDFSLDLANVELYIDNSRKFQVYDALGMEQRKALKSNMNEKLDALGYYLLRACFGNTSSWCSGLGFSHKNNYLGGVFLVGEGCKINFRWRDETGIDPIPTQDLLDACAKLRKRTKAAGGKVAAGKPEEELVGMVYVPV
mmetsp:Transcript_13779/g.31810  ORF Transcript_13779/g.31810 Transcript_13779/m.31810 type:complete len:256 (-) Transcript_13779:906-1673(-)